MPDDVSGSAGCHRKPERPGPGGGEPGGAEGVGSDPKRPGFAAVFSGVEHIVTNRHIHRFGPPRSRVVPIAPKKIVRGCFRHHLPIIVGVGGVRLLHPKPGVGAFKRERRVVSGRSEDVGPRWRGGAAT